MIIVLVIEVQPSSPEAAYRWSATDFGIFTIVNDEEGSDAVDGGE
jgi:hypothetical protein